MKNKIIFGALIIFSSILNQSFSQTEVKVTPNGFFDKVYDNFGNQHDLIDLNLTSQRLIGHPNQVSSLPTTTCGAGYFKLFFNTNNTFLQSTSTQTLICQVFHDISTLINSNIASQSINIYVDVVISNSLLAQASPFYVFPLNPTNPNQGLIDGTIYKALVSGSDPYLNIPISFSNSTNFYHGFVQVNPNPQSVTPLSSWYIGLNGLPSFNQYDLYTTLLHEITHSLGFTSLVTNTGNSFFGTSNNFYTRYDNFLYDYSGNKLIVPSQSLCPYSNLTFTLNPNPSIYSANTGCVADISTCSIAAQYTSINVPNVKVYTPNCWNPSSSLSHFEDMCNINFTTTPSAPLGCTPTPSSPGANNMYFTMANNNSVGPCYTKRFLKEEEKMVLCDLGYSLNLFYTSASGALIDGSSNTHSYSTNCNNLSVVGLNDGFVNNNFIFTTTSNSIAIPTFSLLNNDLPNSNLSVTCEEVIYTNTVNLASAAVSGTNLIINATAGSGLVLVKYYPKHSSGVLGNATYVFVYFLSNNCNPVNACNLIQNGGFESIIGSLGCGMTNNSTGPIISCWDNHSGNAAVLSRNCTNGTFYNLNVNTIGSAPAILNSFNGAGNDKVVALNYSSINQNNYQVIKNNLSSPLVPNNVYKFTMLVSNPKSALLLNNQANNSIVITVCSNPTFPFLFSGTYPGSLNVIAQFTIPASTSWTQVSQIFTFTPTQNHTTLLIGINATITSSLGLSPPNGIWCYLDEVSLLPQPSPQFNLSSTICANQTITDLDQFTSSPSIGSFSGTGVSLNNGIYNFNFTPSISPGVYPIAYTYTINGGGCNHTIYNFVTVSTNTNLLMLTPTVLCNVPSTLNLQSLITNTNFINGTNFSINSSTVLSNISFTSLGTYTVSATNNSTVLCQAGNITNLVMVYTTGITPTLIINNSPTNTAFACSGTSIQLSAFQPSLNSFYWQPGNLIGAPINVTPTISTVYTLQAYNSGGGSVCPTNQTVQINVLSLNSSSNVLCITNPTINLLSLFTSTLGTNGTFTIYNSSYNSGAINPGAFTFPNPSTYTVGYSSSTCTIPITTTINVYNVPTPPTLQVSSTVVCGGMPITISIIPTTITALSYTLQPGNSVFSNSNTTYSFQPSVSGTYSLLASNPQCAIATSNTVSIVVDPTICACPTLCLNSLSGTVSSSPQAFTEYCINNDITIVGAVTFSASDFRISPGVKINVGLGGTLTIAGSHLYACANMWQGIVVTKDAALNIEKSSTGESSLIEDALIAVDIKSLTAPHPFAGINGKQILYVDETTFNKNEIGIQIYNLPMNTGTNQPCVIKNTLFTSRYIPSQFLTWPSTSAIKNSSSGNSSPLQTPWVDNFTFPPATMKAPNLGKYPENGIVLKDVGNTVGCQACIYTFTSMTIGEAGNNAFNLFDNLKNGIYGYLANFKVINSIFQNGRGLCRSANLAGTSAPADFDMTSLCDKGASGIKADSPWNDEYTYRNKIEVVQTTSSSVTYSNYFYDMTTAIEVNDYIDINVSDNNFRSFMNTYPLNTFAFNNQNYFGNIGLKIRTNYAQFITADKNQMYNIRNGILFTVTQGGSNNGNGTYGRYIGRCLMRNNIFAPHVTTPVANEFVNMGIGFDDPINAPLYFPASVQTMTNVITPSIAISQNTVINSHNGISINSYNGNVVEVSKNKISLTTQPNNYVNAGLQNGIMSSNAQSVKIHMNEIAGNSTVVTTPMNSIYSSLNNLLSVSCNTTKGTSYGIDFNHSQTVSRFEDNTFDLEYFGLSLHNQAKLTPTTPGAPAIGDQSWPTNNEWLNTSWWGATGSSGPFKTGVIQNGTIPSSAQNAKLNIQYNTGNYDPDGSAYLFGGVPQKHEFFHTPINGLQTLLNVNVGTYATGCRSLSARPYWYMAASADGRRFEIDQNNISLLEEIVSNGNTNTSTMTNDEYIEKTLCYRMLGIEPSILGLSGTLNTFYTNCSGNSINKFCDVESKLAVSDFTSAASILSSVTAGNSIESNYLLYYNIFIKTSLGTYDASDSANLKGLTVLCPFTDGAIVYQARALFNSIYNCYRLYYDNCNGNEIGRATVNSDVQNKTNKNLEFFVVQKSELFPNPNEGSFNIKFNKVENSQNVTVYIYCNDGRLLEEQKKSIEAKNDYFFKTQLNNGIYQLKIKYQDGSIDIHRILISK